MEDFKKDKKKNLCLNTKELLKIRCICVMQ